MYLHVPHKIFLSMAIIPFQYEKMVVHKKFKVKNEVTLSFVDI